MIDGILCIVYFLRYMMIGNLFKGCVQKRRLQRRQLSGLAGAVTNVQENR